MRLKNKVAIITGAGSGISEATAILFAQEGASVVCMDIKNADRTAATIIEKGGKAIALEKDVTKLADWEGTLTATIAAFGKVDILCNIAGTAEASSLVDVTETQFDNMIAINLKGVLFGMKTVIPEMKKNGGGKIVNVASLGGHVGIIGLPHYVASKGGVLALTREAAAEFATDNINVNSISPGMIMTPLQSANTPEMLEQQASTIPMKRLGDPIEVAYSILWLSSDEASYITGADILVDGGVRASL